MPSVHVGQSGLRTKWFLLVGKMNRVQGSLLFGITMI